MHGPTCAFWANLTSFTLKNTDANWTSYLKAASAPAGPGAQQVWAKPQPNGAVAVILINGGSTPMKQTVTFDSIGLRGAGTRAVRDIWARKDLHQAGEKVRKTPGWPRSWANFSPL